ncbi:bifunctional diguanylate cyclase/phosphodiesterase, partial [Amnibacterium sp.]|uniref:putative bifunctional diguanylate cyclase/phosphodiesterase n=1 Tax=Amnibacterium sp. TaxID=1872496 RepID=UPI00261B8903
PGDTVSRVGGDEFVIVLEHVSGEDEVQPIIRRLEEALAVPLRIGNRTVSVRLSMGLAFSSDPSPEVSPSAAGRALIQAADLAMYQRKSRGGRALAGVSLGRLQTLAADLRGAVGRGEIAVQYQPQVDLAHGGWVAVEALVRWIHPVLGTVYPDEFIPIAEMNGEIGAIGHFVVRQACRDVARLRTGAPGLRLSVNVSSEELDFPGFVANVMAALADASLPAGALTLEVAESRLPADRAAALGRLAEAAANGIGVAIDDFGADPTSLSQLRELPLTELKVHRSAVQLPAAERLDLLAGIVGFARGFGLRTVAVGVGSDDELARARAVGFDRAQGFALAAPMPLDELARRLTARVQVAAD